MQLCSPAPEMPHLCCAMITQPLLGKSCTDLKPIANHSTAHCLLHSPQQGHAPEGCAEQNVFRGHGVTEPQELRGCTCSGPSASSPVKCIKSRPQTGEMERRSCWPPGFPAWTRSPPWRSKQAARGSTHKSESPLSAASHSFCSWNLLMKLFKNGTLSVFNVFPTLALHI